MAYTYSGKVYAWGLSVQYTPTKPTLVSFPSKAIKISEVACGTSHALALSVKGKVGELKYYT